MNSDLVANHFTPKYPLVLDPQKFLRLLDLLVFLSLTGCGAPDLYIQTSNIVAFPHYMASVERAEAMREKELAKCLSLLVCLARALAMSRCPRAITGRHSGLANSKLSYQTTKPKSAFFGQDQWNTK